MKVQSKILLVLLWMSSTAFAESNPNLTKAADLTGVAGDYEKSCISGGTAPGLILFNKIDCVQKSTKDCPEGSNLKSTEIKVIEGQYGPEVQIGKFRIFLASYSKAGESGENQQWCLIDTTKKGDEGKADCGNKLASEDKNPKPIKIPGTNLTITPKKSGSGKAQKTQLQVDYDDGRGIEKMVISGKVSDSSGGKVKSEMNVYTVNGKMDRNGSVKAAVEGKSGDTDKLGGTLMKDCRSTLEKERPGKNLPKPRASYSGLNGQCFNLQGAANMTTDPAKDGCMPDNGRSTAQEKASGTQ